MEHPYNFAVFHIDEDFHYAEEIVNFLERSGQNLRGYIGDRDSSPARPILSNIVESIEDSTYVMVLISNKAIADAMWMHQVHMALIHRLENQARSSTVIPIYLPDLEESRVPGYLRMREVARFNDPHFWKSILRLF